MVENHFIEWRLIAKKIQNRTTPEEDQLFQEWYDADEKNQAYFAKAQFYFENYYTGEEHKPINKQDAWNEFLEYTKKDKKNPGIIIFKYAAGILIPLLCCWIAYTLISPSGTTSPQYANTTVQPGEPKAILLLSNGQKILLSKETQEDTLARESNVIINHQSNSVSYHTANNTTSESTSTNTIMTPRGGEYQITLSDGTHITLNAESQLTYPVKFSSNLRKVKLSGEAWFEVTHNESAPFIIETTSGEIKVLGTSFNVSAYQDDDVLQTTLVQGSVAFRESRNSEEKILKPGEQITYNKINRTTEIQKVNTDLYCSWRNGKFIMESERLEDIMKRLSRWYNVDVFFQNETAKDLIFTGDLEKYEKCDIILHIIELSTNVKFTIKGNTITVI